MDIEKELKKLKLKKYNYLLGKKKTKVWIYNFKNPIKKKKYKDTLYYFFKAKVVEIDDEKIESNNHTIQLPAKTIVLSLFEQFKERSLLDEEKVCVSIERKDNYNYNITILR